MIEDITEYISITVDNIDKIIQYLQAYQERSREQDIAMIKTHEMRKEEIVQRLIETSKILESVSDK